MGDVNLRRIKNNSWLRGLFFSALIVLALWLARSEKYSYTPETTFTTIKGERITLKALQGKPVLITFWATSCGICIKEFPQLIALHKQFHPLGLEIIAIAMAYDPPNRVVALAHEQNLPYPVVLDMTSEHANAFGRIWGTPTTYLIDQNSIVSKRVVGAFDPADMQNRIEQLLKSTSTSRPDKKLG